MGFVGDADLHFAFVSRDVGIDALLRDQAELNGVLLGKLVLLAVRARLVPLSAVRHAQLSLRTWKNVVLDFEPQVDLVTHGPKTRAGVDGLIGS